MRKNRKKLTLSRETLHAMTIGSSGLRGVAGGIVSAHTCGVQPCTVACSNSCSDCCSGKASFCC